MLCYSHKYCIVCLEKKDQLSNVSLSTKVVAEHISNLSGNIYDQRCEKAKHCNLYSVALDKSTDVTDNVQLAIYVQGVDDSFEVMEELLTVISMHGHKTGQGIFCPLCSLWMLTYYGRVLLE